MAVYLDYIDLSTRGNPDIIDITTQVIELIKKSSIRNGLLTLFVPGSTCAITTIEYESGVVQDLQRAIERLAPQNMHYDHDARWHDGNGFAHVRAALLGPSLSLPIADGHPLLGTWQQIVLCDFDNRPRQRKICVQVSGDE